MSKLNTIRINELPKNTQLLNYRASIQIQAVWDSIYILPVYMYTILMYIVSSFGALEKQTYVNIRRS